MQIEAPAKVNLYLRVGERRPDGYHEIQTIFHSIALSDILEINEASVLQVTCSTPEVPGGEANLAYRAAALLADQYSLRRGASIHIHKRVPTQAGLGGGSADAAAVLVALNYLWNLGASVQTLRELGALLGADVPFCIAGGAAYAEGIGEQLTLLPPLPEIFVVVVKPQAAISTREAYGWLDAAPRPSGPSPDRARDVVQSGNLKLLPTVLYNDFQTPALAHLPEIGRAYTAMTARMEGVLLAGSGAALFGIARNRSHARQVAGELQQEGWLAISTRLTGGRQ